MCERLISQQNHRDRQNHGIRVWCVGGVNDLTDPVEPTVRPTLAQMGVVGEGSKREAPTGRGRGP